MFLALSSLAAAGVQLDRDRPGPSSRAVPLIEVTLFLRNRNSIPWVSSLTTLFLLVLHRAEVELDRRAP